MQLFIKLAISVLFCCLIALLPGCGTQKDYAASTTTWADVNKKFQELEHEQVVIMEVLKDKPSDRTKQGKS